MKSKMLVVGREEVEHPNRSDLIYCSVCCCCHIRRWCCRHNLLDEFLRLKVASQVQDLPSGQTEKAAHTEDAEDQYPMVRGLVGVAHLFLAFSHQRECLDDRI